MVVETIANEATFHAGASRRHSRLIMQAEISHIEFRAALKACDLRQKDIVAMAGRTVSMVSNWATGKCPIPPYIATILILANPEDARHNLREFNGDAFASSFLFEWYEVLGLEPTASLEEARSARNLLAKQYHPDSRQKGYANHRIMARISTAFEEAKIMIAEREKDIDRRAMAMKGRRGHGTCNTAA